MQVLWISQWCARSQRLESVKEESDGLWRPVVRETEQVRSYYTRGRHSNVDCFYLAQNYFKLPRQTIRENANFVCLFPQDMRNINHIYSDHISSDVAKDEFRTLGKTAWNKRHGCVVIHLTIKKDNGKYRVCLDTFYMPNWILKKAG